MSSKKICFFWHLKKIEWKVIILKNDQNLAEDKLILCSDWVYSNFFVGPAYSKVFL